MTLRLPPTSACAAAARRPSPVPRARVRRCPALIARSRRRCADWQGSAGGLAWDGGWPYAVRCRAWLLRGCLLCGGLTFTGGLAHSWSSAGRAGRRRNCCSTAQGARGRSWPALAAAAVQAGREPGFCCGPPAATATARILGTDCRSGGLQPLSSGSRAGQPQQGQPQQPCSRGL